MYRANSESRKNKNTSASNDGLNNESTTEESDTDELDEPNDFFFDVIPGNNETSLKGVLEQTMTMDLQSLREVYRRLVKLSDVNEELTLYMSERLDKQDRIAESRMATSEAVQSVNDNWTKRLAKTRRLHGNYRNEEIRIKCEHLRQQTESQILEERNEALKLEIRSIVHETEEIQRRRDASEENMCRDDEEVRAKAGELVMENEKKCELLAALKAELNDFKIRLLNDDEQESTCGEDVDKSDTVLKETDAVITTCVRTDVDIDLINIDRHEPEIDTPRLTKNYTHNPNGSSNYIVDTIEDTIQNRDNSSMAKTLQDNRKVESEAKFHKLNNYTVFEQENSGRHLLEISVEGLYQDNYQVAAGINTKSLIPDVLRNTTVSGDSGVKVSQSQQSQHIVRQLLCLDTISEATNISNRGLSIVNAPTKNKITRDTRKHRSLTKYVPKTDENIKQHHINLDIRPKTGPVKRFVHLPNVPGLGISSSKESMYVSPPETRITDKSSKVKPAHRADTHADNISKIRSLMKKQLPSISRADIKPKTKRCLEMYSVYVENVLPSISPQNTNTENGVICDVLVSSPRPLFTTRTDTTCKTRPSLGKAEKTCSIKPSLSKVNTTRYTRPSLGKLDTTRKTIPSLGKVNTTRYTIPSLGKVDTTRNTPPSLGKLDTTRYTRPSLGNVDTTRKTRLSLCKTGTSCNIKPSLSKRETAYNLKPSLGKAHSTYNLKSYLGKADSTYNLKPLLGKADSTYNLKSYFGKADSTYNLKPSLDKAISTYNLKSYLGKADSTYNLRSYLGKADSTYNLKSYLGKADSTYNLKPSLGKADTTCNLKSPIESGDNGTPKTDLVEVIPFGTETYIQLSGNKKLLSKRE